MFAFFKDGLLSIQASFSIKRGCLLLGLVGLIGAFGLSGCGASQREPSVLSPPDHTAESSRSSDEHTGHDSSSFTASTPAKEHAMTNPNASTPVPSESEQVVADVLSVETTGESGAYRFSVTIQSPDTGCDQYANWWEVISPGGDLIHRRVLLHSHVEEQPFTRSSGPIVIAAEQSVIVRAHMDPQGYGGVVLQGSVAEGFTPAALPADFAMELAEQPPLPTSCSF